MRTRSLLHAALSLVALVAAVHAEEPAGDQARLQGRWSARVGPEKQTTLTLTIRGTAATFAVAGPNGEVAYKGEIKINETARPYKAIDWVNFHGPDGQTAPTNRGIYRLSGDTITVCNGGHFSGFNRTCAGSGKNSCIVALKRLTVSF